MPVTAQTPINTSTGNGVTTVFPYTFKILQSSDMLVLADGVEVVGGYTVSGVGNDAGGNVTFSTAPANGVQIVRKRDMAYARSTDYQANGDLLADTLDDDQDAPVMMIQQLSEEVGRAFSVPPGSTPPTLPATLTPDRYWRNNATGDGVDFVDLTVGTDSVALAAALAASTGSSLVGHIASGAGAVPRTVQTAIRQLQASSVSNLAALRASNFAPDIYMVSTSGYYSSNDGGGASYYYDSTDTTTADDGFLCVVDAGGRRWKLNHNKRITFRQAGAKGDAITDDTVAVRKAFSGWATIAGAVGGCKLYAEPGQYKITATVDLRSYFTSLTTYANLEFEMCAGAIFKQSAALFPMLYFAPVDGATFANGLFKFGSFDGSSFAGTGCTFRNIVNSRINIVSASSFNDGAGNGDALRFDTGTTAGVYNNLISVGSILSNNFGFLAFDAGSPPHGFQGNTVEIGHCAFNVNGISINNQSTSNTFRIGSLEGSTSKGVIDSAGYNIWRINFSNDIVEIGTANGRTDIEGYGFSVLNSGNSTGWVKDNATACVPQAPALPASNVAYTNAFKRPAHVTVSGGSVSSITIGGVLTGLTSGTFSIPYGMQISIIYSSAPTWLWTFT